MTWERIRHGPILAAILLGVAALSAGVFAVGYLQAVDGLARRGEADLVLASDRLGTRLMLTRELAVLTADHPALAGLEDPARLANARALLVDVADKTGAYDLFYADAAGWVMASARAAEGPTLTGRDLRIAPDFIRAMRGALGRARMVEGDQRLFRYTAPVMARPGEVLGVAGVIADAAEIEQTWPGAMPPVFFTDAEGRVFTANRSELLLTRLDAGLAAPGDAPRLRQVRHLAGREIWVMQPTPYLPRVALHLTRDLPVIDLRGEILVDLRPALRTAATQAAAVAGALLFFAALLFMVAERRRVLALDNQRLEARVAARTAELETVNRDLRREVAERRTAERALKDTQDKLVQAGKLSALGQMSAGISHELNQPLMAIRSFAENGAIFLRRGRADVAGANLQRIADMADRMGRIIRNLRAFARQESAPAGRVDLVASVRDALELTGPRLREVQVEVDHAAPQDSIWVRAGEVRLGQVCVNLITNAADAMQDRDTRRLTIRYGPGAQVRFRDTGPGLEAPEKMFEPFYTTKEVGQGDGLGLGLSISYGIVQSFGGDIAGRTHEDGGAEFALRLDAWADIEGESAA